MNEPGEQSVSCPHKALQGADEVPYKHDRRCKLCSQGFSRGGPPYLARSLVLAVLRRQDGYDGGFSPSSINMDVFTLRTRRSAQKIR